MRTERYALLVQDSTAEEAVKAGIAWRVGLPISYVRGSYRIRSEHQLRP